MGRASNRVSSISWLKKKKCLEFESDLIGFRTVSFAMKFHWLATQQGETNARPASL